jgi:hypothetical protein
MHSETAEMIYVWIDRENSVLKVMQSGSLLPAYAGYDFPELVTRLGDDGWHEVGRWDVSGGQKQIAFKRAG